MIERIPRYAAYVGGIENPLGARALYLYHDGKDTQFRIHGTNWPARLSDGDLERLHPPVKSRYNYLYSRAPLGGSGGRRAAKRPR